jgi:hypothetical protein
MSVFLEHFSQRPSFLLKFCFITLFKDEIYSTNVHYSKSEHFALTAQHENGNSHERIHGYVRYWRLQIVDLFAVPVAVIYATTLPPGRSGIAVKLLP